MEHSVPCNYEDRSKHSKELIKRMKTSQLEVQHGFKVLSVTCTHALTNVAKDITMLISDLLFTLYFKPGYLEELEEDSKCVFSVGTIRQVCWGVSSSWGGLIPPTLWDSCIM